MEIQPVGIKEFQINLYKYSEQSAPQKQDLLALKEAVRKISQLLQN